MDLINQNSDYDLLLSFTDENGNKVTPSAASYRIDDVGSGNAITGNNANAWIAITPTGNTYDLRITANQNALLGNNSDREERVVTTKFTYSADLKQDTAEYRYFIMRLANLLKT